MSRRHLALLMVGCLFAMMLLVFRGERERHEGLGSAEAENLSKRPQGSTGSQPMTSVKRQAVNGYIDVVGPAGENLCGLEARLRGADGSDLLSEQLNASSRLLVSLEPQDCTILVDGFHEFGPFRPSKQAVVRLNPINPVYLFRMPGDCGFKPSGLRVSLRDAGPTRSRLCGSVFRECERGLVALASPLSENPVDVFVSGVGFSYRHPSPCFVEDDFLTCVELGCGSKCELSLCLEEGVHWPHQAVIAWRGTDMCAMTTTDNTGRFILQGVGMDWDYRFEAVLTRGQVDLVGLNGRSHLSLSESGIVLCPSEPIVRIGLQEHGKQVIRQPFDVRAAFDGAELNPRLYFDGFASLSRQYWDAMESIEFKVDGFGVSSCGVDSDRLVELSGGDMLLEIGDAPFGQLGAVVVGIQPQLGGDSPLRLELVSVRQSLDSEVVEIRDINDVDSVRFKDVVPGSYRLRWRNGRHSQGLDVFSVVAGKTVQLFCEPPEVGVLTGHVENWNSLPDWLRPSRLFISGVSVDLGRDGGFVCDAILPIRQVYWATKCGRIFRKGVDFWLRAGFLEVAVRPDAFSVIQISIELPTGCGWARGFMESYTKFNKSMPSSPILGAHRMYIVSGKPVDVVLGADEDPIVLFWGNIEGVRGSSFLGFTDRLRALDGTSKRLGGSRLGHAIDGLEVESANVEFRIAPTGGRGEMTLELGRKGPEELANLWVPDDVVRVVLADPESGRFLVELDW